MKNSLNYIATLVVVSAAALVTEDAIYAQNLEAGTYQVQNGIAFAKRSTVNEDGTYTVDLETFVTGEVTQTLESVPVDVVLVLDVSGSMDDTITNYSYTLASVSSITGSGLNWTASSTSQSTNYYYNYNGEYYEVFKVRAHSGGWNLTNYFFLQFQANGTTYYINTSGQVVTNRPTNVTNDSTNLLNSNVQLYSRQTSSTRKIDAMKTAVNAFIEEIRINDLYEDDGVTLRTGGALGNRIAIVKFAGTLYNNDTNAYEPVGNGNHTYRDGNYTYNNTEVVRGLTYVETGSGNLTSAIESLNEGGATAADYGMQLAYNIIDHIETTRNSNKTVVFFTDGSPTHQSNFDNTVANDAIDNSHDIKSITYGTGDDATHPIVFSVGLFSSKPATNSNIYTFMNRISSNYPGATSMTNNTTQASANYYLDASEGSAEDLKNIFTSIAHVSGGSGNVEVNGGASLTVDIVSTSFSVPKGYEDNPSAAITVLVAPCTGKTQISGVEYLTFGAEDAPSEYGLPPITPSISESDNKVSTTGFDYSTNWCGPDATSTTGYHGYKQIIRFIITVNGDAVGGPAVETNDPNSGIYLPGQTEPLIKFNRPTVKVPVNIWIQKQGLVGDDSAVFTLYTTPLPANYNPDTFNPNDDSVVWTNFTKVVINSEVMDDNGMVKITGLDPDFFYKIKEDAWAFGYTYQAGGVLYTVGDNVENPFVFVNTPKPVKFSEATVRNVFTEKTSTSSGGSED